MKLSKMLELALENHVVGISGTDELRAVVGPIFVRIKRADRTWRSERKEFLVLGNLALFVRRAGKDDMMSIRFDRRSRDNARRTREADDHVRVRVVNANELRQTTIAPVAESVGAAASDTSETRAS